MSELYWITRLDITCVFLEVLLVLCSIMFIGYMIAYLTPDRYDYESKQDYQDSRRRYRNKAILFILLFIGMFICRIFTPTTKEALAIYSANVTGSVEENDEMKKLPDKCIQATDKFK